MGFAIAFTGETASDDPALALGVLTLGGHTEYFRAPQGYWATADYEAGWSVALDRIVRGAATSCLVTAMRDPREANFLEVWPLYREDEVVYVQNQLIFLRELDREFDPATPWEFVEPRCTVDEDGQRISEWQVDVAAVDQFLKRR